MPQAKPDYQMLAVKLPAGMRDKIDAMAEKSHRNRTNQTIYLLEYAIEQLKQQQAVPA